jgi:hypothetical protein
MMIIIILLFQLRAPEEAELHIKQILIQCTYNNTTFLCRTESETKVMIYTIHINTTYDNNNPLF